LYPITNWRLKAGFHFSTSEFFARIDLFPFSASILPRLADVIKGKRSLRAKKFASGTGLKVDFHSVQNVAQSIFCDRFLLKCVQPTTANEIYSA
jgi:hypothetical protein